MCNLSRKINRIFKLISSNNSFFVVTFFPFVDLATFLLLIFFALIIFSVWLKSKMNMIRKEGIEKYSLKNGWDYSKFSLALPNNYEKNYNITSSGKSYFYAIMTKDIDGIEVSVMDYYFFSTKKNCTCNHTLILLRRNNFIFPKFLIINKDKKNLHEKYFEIGVRFSNWGSGDYESSNILDFKEDKNFSNKFQVHSDIEKVFFNNSIRDSICKYASDSYELETFKDSLLISYNHVMNIEERKTAVSLAIRFFYNICDRVNE